MAKKYKVTYDRNGCIGAAQCTAVYGKRWKLAGDGKADLIGGKEKGGKWELIIDEKEYAQMKKAADACPVGVIKISEMK